MVFDTTKWSTTSETLIMTFTYLGVFTESVKIWNYQSNTYAWQNWTINVVNPLWAPHVIGIDPTIAYVGFVYDNQIVLNETGYITIPNAPRWISYLQSDNMLIHGAPTSNDIGNWSVNIQVHPTLGNLGIYNWHNYTISVLGTVPVTFTSTPNTTGVVGELWTYTPTTSAGNVTILLDGPSWLGTSNAITWNGTPSHNGTYPVVVTARLHLGNGSNTVLSWQYFTIVVGDRPIPIFTSTPTINMNMGTALQYIPTTDIPSAITVLISPSWASYSRGAISGNPAAAGVYHITILAISNEWGTHSTQSFDIRINPAVWPPLNVPVIWLTVLPIFFLIVIALVTGITKDPDGGIKFSITNIMVSVSIGIGLLVWTNVFPVWSYIISGVLLVLLIYRAQASNGMVITNG
jgi:hypothetical protein